MKKKWKKIDLQEIEDAIHENRTQELFGKAAAQKSDAELFTVDRVGVKDKQKKTLYIDQILNARSAVKGIVGVTKKKKAIIDLQKLKKIKPIKKKEKVVEVKDIWEEEGVVSRLPSRINPPPAISFPAVEIAHPGASYNPDPEAHQKLIEIAVNQEVKKQEQRKVGKEIQREVLLKLQNADADLTMEVDLPSEDEEDDVEVTRQPQEQKRKTTAMRNKERREKELQLLKQREDEQKKIMEQIEQIDTIKQEIEEKEKRAPKEKKIATAKVSSIPYEPLPIPVCLSDELPSSLRQLKPEGNLFKERFNSLQKRNIIEPRVPVSKRRRYQLKVYEKHALKNFKLK